MDQRFVPSTFAEQDEVYRLRSFQDDNDALLEDNSNVINPSSPGVRALASHFERIYEINQSDANAAEYLRSNAAGNNNNYTSASSASASSINIGAAPPIRQVLGSLNKSASVVVASTAGKINYNSAPGTGKKASSSASRRGSRSKYDNKNADDVEDYDFNKPSERSLTLYNVTGVAARESPEPTSSPVYWRSRLVEC